MEISEEELNQPCYLCVDCKEYVTFPFGIGVVWPGLCACARVLYRWDGHERKLEKCVVAKEYGSRFSWTRIDLAQKG